MCFYTVNDLIIAKTAKIGEKLSFRRMEVITKKDNESFGDYIHMGGKIAVLTVVLFRAFFSILSIYYNK
mgnify:CR=1 FL=1